MLEHGRMNSNDLSKSSRLYRVSYTRIDGVFDYKSVFFLCSKVIMSGIAAFLSEPLGSPVNPHYLVKGGY